MTQEQKRLFSILHGYMGDCRRQARTLYRFARRVNALSNAEDKLIYHLIKAEKEIFDEQTRLLLEIKLRTNDGKGND